MQDEAAVLALGAAGFFGLALVLTQFGLRHMKPVPGAAISVTTTAAAFLAASPVLVDWTAMTLPAVLVFVAVGSLFPATVTMLTFRANQQLGPHVAGALGNLAPLFAVLFAIALLGEVPGLWQAAGIAVVLVGATTLMLGSSRGVGAAAWAAMLLPLAAASPLAVASSERPPSTKVTIMAEVSKWTKGVWEGSMAAARSEMREEKKAAVVPTTTSMSMVAAPCRSERHAAE